MVAQLLDAWSLNSTELFQKELDVRLFTSIILIIDACMFIFRLIKQHLKSHWRLNVSKMMR